MQKSVIAAFLLLVGSLSAQAKSITVTVSAPEADCASAPVSCVVDGSGATVILNGQRVPAQAQRTGGKTEVTWIAPALKRGETLRYTVDTSGRSTAADTGKGIAVRKAGNNVEIKIDGEPFTTYDATTGPNKPYFYPIYGPGQKLMVRRYPLEKVAGETNDHPHHRGMWFTHGAVNGVDYWTEGNGIGKTVNRAYSDLVSGPVYGGFRAATDWIDPAGKKVAEDTREVRVYNLPEGRLMDFTVTIKPVAGPLLFGDTKEGSFGLRVPDSIRPESGGHILNSNGVKDAATWSKRADWVDYYGPVDGQTEGVAIFDDPRNLRHPTYWHVRDYGLFAVNPFGVHDFVKGEPAGAGDYTVPANGSLTFRYRILFHRGTADDAHVPELWNSTKRVINSS